MIDEIVRILDDLKKESMYRELRRGTGLCFTSNDYLGLSRHPDLISRTEGLTLWGAGSQGSRLLGGNSGVFEEAEHAICEFFRAPAALFFSSGYLANLAVTTVLSPLFERVFSDEKNHASLIDGLRLAGVKKVIVPHQSLMNVKFGERDLFVTESLFSMEGDFADVSALQNRFVILDEAHAAGIFREDGRGLMQSLCWDRMVSVVTFGKAFGVSGACVLCRSEIRELLINKARSFIFTTAPPPVIPYLVMESLVIVKRESWRREALWERSMGVREILKEVTDTLPDDEWCRRSPIIAFACPPADRALRFSQSMRESGFDLGAIRSPTVPRGAECLRISLTLHVSEENTLAMARELVRKWKAFS